MRKIFLLAGLFIFISKISEAQLLCSNNGNLILYTNYDGGTLNIDVDVNMPNIKIGIVTYEAVIVNLSGAFVNNVTAIQYAGYNGGNNNCGGPPIPTTIINGAPVGVTPVIAIYPPAPFNTPNGNPNIVCGYSCDTTVSQGGCNTVDQINAYFMNLWPGTLLRFHKIQYNCWTGSPQTLSGAGNCCLMPAGNPMLVSTLVSQPSCNGGCDGSALAVATGGTPPYGYQWIGGPAAASYSNLCPGSYTIIVADAAANSAIQTVVVTNPPLITSTFSQTACFSYLFNGTSLTASGQYIDTFQSVNNCDSIVTLNLTINTVSNAVTQTGITLTATAGYTYKWLNCSTNTLIAGAVSQTYTPSVSGNYAVIVTANGCTDTSICKNVVVTGIDEINENTLISVFPNPVKDELFIEIDAGYIGKNCNVYDAIGQLVATKKLSHTSNSIRVGELSKGMYIVEIEGVNKKWKVQK